MSDKLPYELTTGVTATQKGLVIETWADAWNILSPHIVFVQVVGHIWRAKWPDVSDRLRYREGEPWCWADPEAMTGIMCPGIKLLSWDSEYDVALHRLAAILCDDAEAFRVLHWAVHNLGKGGQS